MGDFGEIWLSVVIPTYRRPQRLSQCLSGLCEQNFELPWEIIVVNDGGGDLNDILSPFQQQLNLHSLYQSNRGPAAARNLGASKARGSHLTFLDDDCRPSADWSQALTAAVDKNPGAALGGHTVNRLTDNPYAQASQDLLDFLYRYHQSRENYPGTFFTTNNLCVPTADFRALGGFDEGFEHAAGEDREFSFRWRQSGRPMIFVPELIIQHFHSLELATFAKQHFTYGRAAQRYWKKRRRSNWPTFERPFFYLDLLAYPFRRYGFSGRGFLTLLLFGLAQAFNALGYFVETGRRSWDFVRRRHGPTL